MSLGFAGGNFVSWERVVLLIRLVTIDVNSQKC